MALIFFFQARIIATTVTIKTDISSVPGVTTKEITDTIPALNVAVAEDQEVHATSALVADNSEEDKGEVIVVDTPHAASLTRNKEREKNATTSVNAQ